MRLRCVVPLVIAGALASTVALADVGPPPSCGPGERHQYMYGHRCVPIGSHLEQDEKGNVVVVPDGKTLPPATPTAPVAPTARPEPPPTSTFATPPPATVAADNPPGPAPEPPVQRGCACELAEAPTGLSGAAFGLAALLFAVARRRAQRAPGARSR